MADDNDGCDPLEKAPTVNAVSASPRRARVTPALQDTGRKQSVSPASSRMSRQRTQDTEPEVGAEARTACSWSAVPGRIPGTGQSKEIN